MRGCRVPRTFGPHNDPTFPLMASGGNLTYDMTALTQALAPFFLHPAVAAVGLGLVAVPVMIHLINRLRFREVRFAAMEFLLASDERNRRRVLLEQLLLLLLRVLLVLALGALVARLVLDPSTLSILREGAQAHHVVVLDDSGSMRERLPLGEGGGGTAFDAAKAIVSRFAGEASRRPGTVRLTVLPLSRAGEGGALLAERDVTTELLPELTDKLDILAPTHGRFSPADGLTAAAARLPEDGGERFVHLVSDFRAADWADDALTAAVEQLDADGVRVNLVRVNEVGGENRFVESVSGDTAVAAVGVPVRVRATVVNDARAAATDTALTAAVDRRTLPLSERIVGIEPGGTATREFDVVFEEPGRRALTVSLESDALPEDDTFHLPVRVRPKVPVLLVDGAADLAAADAVSLALAPDPDLTGLLPTTGTPEGLRTADLTEFSAVYLLNVPRLSTDARRNLDAYVRGGGGLVWFTGPAIDPDFYAEQLAVRPADAGEADGSPADGSPADGPGLFPVPPADVSAELTPAPRSAGPDVRFGDEPLFAIFTGTENPFADAITVRRYTPVADGWESGEVRTLATLRNGAPLVLSHRVGAGRVLTVLTTASAGWTDWPRNPSYVVFQLEAQKSVARPDAGDAVVPAGTPLTFDLDAAEYLPEVVVERPDDLTATLRAAPRSEAPLEAPPTGGPPRTADELRLIAAYRDTDAPGVYRVRLTRTDGEPVDRWTAANFPPTESRLSVLPADELRDRLAGTAAVTVQEAGDTAWLSGGERGRELRYALLGLIIGLLAAERWLASRLSYTSP